MRNSCFSYHHSRKPRRCNERARARTIGNTVLFAHAAPKKKGRHQDGRFDVGGARAGLGASRRLGRGAAAVVARGVTLTRPLRGAWTLRRTRPRTEATNITSQLVV